ncbi:MAG: nitroreductase family protein [Candidatus Diapherotrites archaeon]|nr:nitroreductase family protein [Candidatus Diapherotrites archaeon]
MDVKEVIWERRTVRRFKQKEVPEQTILRIIEAGLQAPSACNQPLTKFIVISDLALKEKICKEAGFVSIQKIPSPVFVVCDNCFNSRNYANFQSASAAIENMLLYAHSIGIGSWWINSFGDGKKIAELLKIPANFSIVSCVGFGFPFEKPLKPSKPVLNDSVYNNFFLSSSSSKNPDDWQFEEIAKFSEKAVFAKSPEIGYKPLFLYEFKNELHFFETLLGAKNLFVYDIDGNIPFAIASANRQKDFFCVVYSEGLKRWFEKRRHSLGLKNVKILSGDLGAFGQPGFDSIFLPNTLNRLPKERVLEILLQLKKALGKNGKICLSNLNSLSMIGVIFRNGFGRRFGPEIPRSRAQVIEIFKKAGYDIVGEKGFSLFPSFDSFEYVRVPKGFSTIWRVLKKLHFLNFFEKFESKGFPSRFCQKNVFIAKLKKIV